MNWALVCFTILRFRVAAFSRGVVCKTRISQGGVEGLLPKP